MNSLNLGIAVFAFVVGLIMLFPPMNPLSIPLATLNFGLAGLNVWVGLW